MREEGVSGIHVLLRAEGNGSCILRGLMQESRVSFLVVVWIQS